MSYYAALSFALRGDKKVKHCIKFKAQVLFNSENEFISFGSKAREMYVFLCMKLTHYIKSYKKNLVPHNICLVFNEQDFESFLKHGTNSHIKSDNCVIKYD